MPILISGLAPVKTLAEVIVIGTVSKSPLSGSAPGAASTLDVKALAPD